MACRATRSVSRQIHAKPLMAVLIGFALGYIAGLWTGRGGGGARQWLMIRRTQKPLWHKEERGHGPEQKRAIFALRIKTKVSGRRGGEVALYRHGSYGGNDIPAAGDRVSRAPGTQSGSKRSGRELRYHEASRKDAEELVTLYEKRWPGESAVERLEYEEPEAAEVRTPLSSFRTCRTGVRICHKCNPKVVG
jgi:hypothetical protein